MNEIPQEENCLSKESDTGQNPMRDANTRAICLDQTEVDDNGEHNVKRRRLNSSEMNSMSSIPSSASGDLSETRGSPDSIDQDMMSLLSDCESHKTPKHIVSFSNQSFDQNLYGGLDTAQKLTVEELMSCQCGSYQIQAMLEWILGGDNSEANPYNILFGRCLTCGKLEPLETFAKDLQSVGYACCYGGGLTEVVRCFNLGLVLYDHTCGLSNGLFARVSSQHAEQLLGCSPAMFQSLDDIERFRVLERMKELQRYPMELLVSVRQSERGNALECFVNASNIITKHQ